MPSILNSRLGAVEVRAIIRSTDVDKSFLGKVQRLAVRKDSRDTTAFKANNAERRCWHACKLHGRSWSVAGGVTFVEMWGHAARRILPVAMYDWSSRGT
jgi:hypothetical protein